MQGVVQVSSGSPQACEVGSPRWFLLIMNQMTGNGSCLERVQVHIHKRSGSVIIVALKAHSNNTRGCQPLVLRLQSVRSTERQVECRTVI